MIAIEHLTKKFGDNIILDDISLAVKRGEILGFLGPNGAGKTTTMKIITSFWTPARGTVRVGGFDVTTDPLATRKLIGYLPENVPLYEDMRVYEYLKFIAEIRGVKKGEIKVRISKVVGECGLKKVIRKPIEELSKGFRQRVGLAQAIMHEPEILILDEPTTGLDPNQIVEIRDLIKKIGQEKTVIFSTHILSEVSATCDRAVIINNGKIVGEGTPDELTKRAGSREVVYAKIKGPKDKILAVLNNTEIIEKAEIKDKENNEVHGYELVPKNNADIRESLFILAKDNSWSLLELYRQSISLEDVFRELTK